MNCTNEILNFKDFISVSWSKFMGFNTTLTKEELEDRVNNWLQANWEILVESSICSENEFLEVYGYGSDMEGSSSRVSSSDKLPTHRIVCKTKNNCLVKDLLSNEMVNIDESDFMGFVSFDRGYYKFFPPFGFLLLSGNEEIVINYNDVIFIIEKI